MRDQPTFYVTTPIYYVNDAPHIGHAYTTIAADVLARYHRSKGQETFFLTGTDEHGQKILETARGRGMTAKELADSVVVRFKQMCVDLNAANDHFIRTTDPSHERTVQEVFRRLHANGDIYLGEYEGYYHTADERFITETEWDELKDTAEAKYITTVKEKNYFFRLSKYQQPLLDYIEANPNFIQPDYRRNEVVGYIRKGLKDLSVSRTTFDWGVPVPGDPAHVIYVWIDALTNYLSALGFCGEDETNYRRFWPASVHLIGKDILVFHAIYWPAMLMSLGLPLPKTVFAHGWWTANGAKISKRVGNVVNPGEMIERYGLDAFRYFLLRENTFGRDGDFSETALIGRINTELANDLGNLLQRTRGMLQKYFDGTIPARPAGGDDALAVKAVHARRTFDSHMERLAFREALLSVFEYVDAGNKYIVAKEPWALHKQGEAGRDELARVLYDLLEALRVISCMLHPFIPASAERIQVQLGVATPDFALASCDVWGGLPSGATLPAAESLFPRVPDETIADAARRQQDVLNRLKAEVAPADAAKNNVEPTLRPVVKPEVSYDDFAKMDLRLAVILAAEKVPKADKLLKLTVDAGEGAPRTLAAGIAQHYSPESLVGRRVLIVANLAPRVVRGVESRGMVLAAFDEAGGRLAVCSPDAALADLLPPGTAVS